jgi:parallel beta-helix repeat protein
MVLVTAFIVLVSSGTFVAQHVYRYYQPPITYFIPEFFDTLTITTNTTLTKDYINTTIIIAADGITLDGDGHKIIGPGTDFLGDVVLDPDNPEYSTVPWEEFNKTVGIFLEGRTGVTVKNCYVTGFSVGFFLKGSDGNILHGNTATNNTDGFGLLESSWNSFEANTVNHNGIGFFLDMYHGEDGENIEDIMQGEIDKALSEGNSFEANTVNHNGLGFLVDLSEGNSFEANTVNHNAFGFLVDLSEGNSFKANTANYNEHFGFWSSDTSNDTFQENTANHNPRGFSISWSNGSILHGNTANHNVNGFELGTCNGFRLQGNIANNNTHAGFHILASSNNTLTGNTASNNEYGICYGLTDKGSPNNRIYHNNFINNLQPINIQTTVNTWDNGYPAGGNYWSDYTGSDVNGDGIGDTPYIINENNEDWYPLMAPMSGLDTGTNGGEKN